MQWSKVKRRFEERLADSLRGRLRVHLTEYRKTAADVGRGWITVDGKEVCSVRIPSFYDDDIEFSTETLDFGRAIGAYLGITAGAALESPDLIIRALPFLDKKVGKKTLEKVDYDSLHAFSKITYAIRCDAEGISIESR